MTRLLRAFWLLLWLLIPGRALAQSSDGPRDVAVITRSVTVPEVPSDYRLRDFGWMKVKYLPDAEARLEEVFKNADKVKQHLADSYGQDILTDVEVRVGRSPEEMAKLAPPEAPPMSYATAITYPSLHLVILSLRSPDPRAEAPDLSVEFRHELSHVALFDAVAGKHVPNWFNEGVAMRASEGPLDRTYTLMQASFARQLIPLSQLDHTMPRENYAVGVAYAQSSDLVRFLMRGDDEARFRSLISRVRSGEAFPQALEDSYGTDIRKLEYQWREDIARRYTFLPFFGGSFIWVLAMVGLVFAYVKKKKRSKLILARWEKEEKIEDDMLKARLLAQMEENNDSMPVPRETPRIEHDGGWHTLH